MERIICLLVLLSFKAFAQDEFIFWAELTSKNFILFYQNENLSSAMTKSKNVMSEFVCELYYNDDDFKQLPRTQLGMIDDDMPKSLKLNFLRAHKDELSNCFIGAKISVKDIVQTNLLKAHQETYIKILPLRFIVEFSQASALVYYLKKK